MIFANIFNIIIGKFSYKQKFVSNILFKINKSLKVGLYSIILLFDLTIN